jgi:hypothetical protein
VKIVFRKIMEEIFWAREKNRGNGEDNDDSLTSPLSIEINSVSVLNNPAGCRSSLFFGITNGSIPGSTLPQD